MSTTPKDGDFVKALDTLAPAPPSSTGPAAAGTATPQPLIADEGALLQAEIDRALLPGTGRTPEELQQIAELDELPPLSDEELARQAEAAPGADGDPATPE